MINFFINSEMFAESCRVEIRQKKPFSSPDVEITGDIEFDVAVTKLAKDINVEGFAYCDVNFSCGKCLDEFVCRLEIPISVTKEFNWDEDSSIDLTTELSEGILLSIPITPLCKADCKGLCPQCGENNNERICGCKPDGLNFSAFNVLEKIKFKEEK